MKQLNQTQIRLIQLLNDKLFHTGSALGKSLGISRTAIWKQINQLIELGLPIKSQTQKGYQLQYPLVLLDAEEIKNHLRNLGFTNPYGIHLFHSLDSTNKFLKELPANPLIDLCFAEQQTQGRGRFGRHWHSPFGENIYCSSRWNLHCDLNRLSGLSLITSLAILTTLKNFIPTDDIKIKWPNDILWHDKKLCGTLIEIIAESNSSAQVIVGIGLNVNADTQHNPLPDKPWCSLYEISDQYFDRNIIIGRLLKNLELYLQRFLSEGLEAFLEEWQNSDYLEGKNISVIQSLNTISGVAKGINSEGLLVLEDESGAIHYLSSGDTTLRKGN